MLQVTNLLEKLSHKLIGWVEGLVIMMPNLLVALCVLTLALPISRWARMLTAGTVVRVTRNAPIANLAGTVVRVLVFFVAASSSLELLKLDKTVTSLLAGVGVVGLALGFAFQDIASNLMSGFMMAMTRPFDVGDLVELGAHQGRITNMSMRDTEVETVDGRSVLIPNREVFQNAIVNFTRTPSRRLELAIGIDYGEDLAQVQDVMTRALADLPGRLASEPVEVLFEEFGDTSVKAQVLIWLSAADELHYRRCRSAAMISIKDALDASAVLLPVPVRQVDIGTELAQRALARPSGARRAARLDR